jgi:hypothetical protein
MYINDLHCASIFSNVYHFADDTNLLNFSSSPKQLAKQMNLDLKCLYNWLNANKISLNASKTEYILFKSPRKTLHYNFRLFISGKRIIASNYIKYLGILLDSNLNWKSQINSIAVKLKKANGALAKLRYYVPTNILVQVYHAIFSSHLQYCCLTWGQPNSLHINRISVLQNCAIRPMTFATSRTSANKLYAKLELLKFSDLIHMQNILLVHNLLHNKLPDSVLNTFAVDFTQFHDNPRANPSGLFNLPFVKTVSFGEHSIRYNALSSWNYIQALLPADKLISADFKHFKNGLKQCFLTSY